MIDYPLCTLTPTNINVVPVYHTRPGQEATNSMRRSLGFSGAQFKIIMADIPVRTVAAVRALRAIVGNMEGDRDLVRIRIPDIYGIDGPWSRATKASRVANQNGIPFATDVMYETGYGHAVPTLEAPLTNNAGYNAREVYVSVPEELPAGSLISIDEFCYTIAGSWTEPDTRNRLKISPPLRMFAAAGSTISLAPVFVGYCTTDIPGDMALRMGKTGTVTLEFMEDLTRLVEDVA